jgi:hypothetical protein
MSQLTPADYIEIYQLYSAYAYALDTGDGAARIATFTPDGVFKSPITHHQADPLENVRKRTEAYGQRERPGVMRHMLLNIHITPTAEGADGYCYLLGPMGQPAADGSQPMITGFYRDTLVRTSAGWRFKTKEVWYGNDDIPPTLSSGPTDIQ